jgi:hypothetical protein
MKGTPISELDVHCFDGNFYDKTRSYLEKRGCIWSEMRIGDQLEALHLTFPPGTVYKKLPPIGDFERYQILFKEDGLVNWSIKRTTGLNTISVPVAYLR